MESNTVERVTEWDSEPFTGGHDGLRGLADREFSGAATDGSAWLFMLNGRVLGCFDGSIESFADADGTAYEAPDPALPLLFAMQETGGETRAEYYSEETPLSEVNRTLESGNFSGYVELSENVLSGDYYVAYYGGRSLPVAFVGNQSERLTGDEAFERADDEVGIYKVNTVDLNITDIPGGDDGSSTAGGVAAEPDEADAGEEPSPEDPAEAASEEPAEPDQEEPEEPAPEESTEPTADSDPEPVEEAEPDEPAPANEATAPEQATEPSGRTASERSTEGTVEREAKAETAERASEERRRHSRTEEAESEPARADRAESGNEARASGPGTAEERKWRGAKTIPALDPEESVDMAEEVPGGVETETDAASAATAPRQRAEHSAAVEELEAERDRLQERVEELTEDRDELQSRADQLVAERDRLERERDEAQTEVGRLENRVEELQSTVDRLESELAEAESELEAVEQYIPEGDHDISEERALEGTNLFVRYDRQGGATLEDAHDGQATRADVNENIRLEHHTDFEDDGAVVEGEPFEEWLHGTMEYGFGRWLVEGFVHDIRETGNQSGLGDLYDAIPDIDRIEFQGTVELPAEEGNETPAETATFDVVLRDRMGSPLVVADLNESREAATESMLGTLIENATPVANAKESLASAFFVTTSYYDPGALETAEEATGGGFLSRDKSKSFVKLSRKGGYHLCLVETRDGEFHVSVPEL